MRPAPDDRGFSLVELMVTIAMLGILAVIALPSIMEALERRKASDAAQSVLGLIEYARVQAASRNRAYLVAPYTPERGACGSLPATTGSLQVWENESSACIGFFPAAPAKSATCVRALDLARDFPTVVQLKTLPENLPANPLCIKPDGRVFQVVGDANPTIVDTIAFHFQRRNATGSREGPVMRVGVPFSGLARVSFLPQQAGTELE